MNKSDRIREAYYENPEFSRKKLAQELNVRESYIRKVIRPLKKNNIKQGHKPLEEKIDFNRTSKNHAKLDLESSHNNNLRTSLRGR
jgi:ribosome-binding protein aMBF1 (putative translation factor)